MSAWQASCTELGFELHEAGIPLLGVDRSWRAQRGDRLVSLRVQTFHDEPYVVIHVPFTTRLRCGLQATTIAPAAEASLPGEPVTDHPLVGWHVRAHRLERARHLLQRFGDELAAASQRGRELTVSDDGLTMWSVDMPDDAEELLPRIEAAERLASRLDAIAGRVEPPRWVSEVRKHWPTFAERHHFELDAGALTMRGVARAGASYRGSVEREVTIRVEEHPHAAPEIGVAIALARPVSRTGSFAMPSAGSDLLQQLLGRHTFGEPGRFVVTAQTEDDAAALLGPKVRGFLERLPPTVAFGRLDEERVELFTAEVLVDAAELEPLVDAGLELASLLEEEAAELGPAPEPAPDPFGAMFGHGAPPSPREERGTRRFALFMAAAVVSMVVVPLAYIELTEPDVGDHCTHRHDCAREDFCLKEIPQPTTTLAPGASPLDRQIHEMSERIARQSPRRVPVDGYCSTSCSADDDCPDAMRCVAVRGYRTPHIGGWVRDEGLETKACVR